jgi:hypothetical protein
VNHERESNIGRAGQFYPQGGGFLRRKVFD